MLTNKIFKTILLLTAITAGISNKIMPMGNNTNTVQELSIDDKNQLNLALKNGDLEAFTTLYKNNPNILQIKNSEGRTLLYFAFLNGHKNIIEFLFISLNPETFISLINTKDNGGLTPLHFAFHDGHKNIIEFLFKSLNPETFISLINAKDSEGFTPLHLAFQNGLLNIIEFIHEKLSPENFIKLMNAKITSGHTPLHFAFQNGHLNIIEFLFKSLDPKTFIALINAKKNNNITPLHFAFKNGHLNIIEFIHEKLSPETFIALMNTRTEDKWTPLHLAFYDKHLNIIKFIYESLNQKTFIALMNAKLPSGHTPLHLAFQNRPINIIEFIHEKLSPETFIALMEGKTKKDFTPLHLAFLNGHLNKIKFIFNKFNSIKISDLNNKIIFTEKLLSNNELLELILNKIKEENNGELKLDYLTDKNKDTIVSALSKNPKCLSRIILDNFDSNLNPNKDVMHKLLNMEFNPNDTVNNNLVSILIYQTLEYCKCNNIVYNIDKGISKNNIDPSDHLQYKKNIETYGKNNTIENTKNFINNFANNAIVLKLLKKWTPPEIEELGKKPRAIKLSNDVIQEHIMGFAGYTYFDNPKNNEVIETLRSKEFNESLINKFANNDTSLTLFPENKKIEDKMEIDK